jgi:hypothetical protein
MWRTGAIKSWYGGWDGDAIQPQIRSLGQLLGLSIGAFRGEIASENAGIVCEENRFRCNHKMPKRTACKRVNYLLLRG